MCPIKRRNKLIQSELLVLIEVILIFLGLRDWSIAVVILINDFACFRGRLISLMTEVLPYAAVTLY